MISMNRGVTLQKIKFKGTFLKIEKVLINDHVRVSKVS